MNRQRVTAVFVVAAVLLAGCVGGLGGGASEDGAGDSEASSGGASGDGASPSGGVGGDGASASGGVGGASDGVLVENRTAALVAAGGYTSVWQMEFVEDGTVVSDISYTTAVDYRNERSTFGMRTSDAGAVTYDYETFHGDGVSYARYGSGDEASYSVAEAGFAPGNSLFAVESFIGESSLAEFSAAGTETYDGVSVTRYERTDRPAWVAAQGGDGEITWTEFNYVVLVDGDGLVRYESWGGEGVDSEGVTQSVQFSYSLTDVGSTTVEDPDWIAAAEQQSRQ